jgi:hypothetical protein
MAVATFDTLKFANILKAAGVPPAQAEAQAVAFAEVVQANFKELVTKEDLDRLAKEVRQEISVAKQEVNGKIDTLAARLAGELTLMKWMLGVTVTGIVGILIRLFFFRVA